MPSKDTYGLTWATNYEYFVYCLNFYTEVAARQSLACAAELTDISQITLEFSATLKTASTNAASYSVTGPSDVTVNSVAFTPYTRIVTLSVTSQLLAGIYSVTVGPGAVKSDIDYPNPVLTATFRTERVRPTAAAAIQSSSSILLTFSQTLRELAATSIPGNYQIDGPSNITVSSVDFTPGSNAVLLHTTGDFTLGQYTVTIAANTAQTVVGAIPNLQLTPTFQCVQRVNVASPAVTLVSPQQTEQLGSDGAITVDISDADGFRRVILYAGYPEKQVTEVVFDGSAFCAPYTGTQAAIENGIRLSGIRRLPSWPKAGRSWLAPHLTVIAIDTQGAENG